MNARDSQTYYTVHPPSTTDDLSTTMRGNKIGLEFVATAENNGSTFCSQVFQFPAFLMPGISIEGFKLQSTEMSLG